MNNILTIALISPYSGNRFATYLNYYAENLLKKGKKVIVISPEFSEIAEYVKLKVPRYLDNFTALPLDEKIFSDNRPNYFELLSRWNAINSKIKQAEKIINAEVDFAFFSPIDPFIRESVNLFLLDFVFNYKWSGIYFNPKPYRLKQLKLNVDPKFLEPDYLFRSKNCVGVCVLDRFITEPLKSRVYKKVVVFPEISNVSIQKKESVYSKQIKEMAKSRVVVGLLGVEQNEGITALIRLIKKVDTDKYFFVFAGKLDFKIMDEKQRQEVELFMNDHAPNILFILQPLSEEEINQIYKEIDISYLYFYNYVSSNNLLTKAAYYQKPILANKDFCVGDTVKKFKIGLSVNGKMEESVNALEFLRLERLDFNVFDKEAFSEYYALQSDSFLTNAFEEIMFF
ncbi:MAG: hypothetical protein ACOVSR_14860 [Bacteroidia bacterium]